MRELDGQPLAVQPVDSLPESTQLVYWCEQILSLVLTLQRRENPLKYAMLDPDHVILDPQRDCPVCFNPGWGALAWNGAGLLQNLSLQKALKKYGTLIQRLGGSEVNLSPALLWMVGRCLSDNPAQNYASFEEVRLSLQRLPIKQQQRSFAHRQSLDEIAFQESLDLPAQASIPLERSFTWLGAAVALISLLFLVAVWLEPPPQPLPHLAVAAQGKIRFLSEVGVDLGEVDLKHPIRGGVASPSGDVIYLALEGRPQVAVLGVASRRLRYLGLSSEARFLDFALGKLFCLQANGQVALFEQLASSEKTLPTQTVEGLSKPVTLRAVNDGREFLVLEPGRLLLVGVGQADAWGSWSQPQLVSALGLDSLVVASLRDGFLQLLSPSLTPGGRHALPGGAGRTELYPNTYRRQFWSLHSQGTLGLWNHPEVHLAGKLDLALRPLAAVDDPLGRLWVLGEQGELLRVDSQESLQFEPVARLKTHDVDGLFYLHQAQGNVTSR